MKNLALYFAMGLWMYVIAQACAIQQADAVKFEAYSASQHALELEQQLKLDAERLQSVDSVAAQIVLDTLRNVQQAREVNLGEISIGQHNYTCDIIHGGIVAPHWHIVPINQ